jgi:mono/diheme cytochrome c family protein/glucose/arabinose dehydrogenase
MHLMLRFLLPLLCLNAVCVARTSNNSPADLPPEHADPVPFLSPTEAIKTFNLPHGLHAELVASEPMIEHPVAISFDADGRMWVCEMRDYMPNIEGRGEKEPTGRISILEDTDGDGRMDKYTVFLDHLVLPRAIACVRGGALVADPPKVLFCRDTNGDGQCDQQTVIATDYGLTGNPEHQPNGLLSAMDNWIYNANYDKRFRYIDGAWTSSAVPEIGQWGVAQDNYGRLFFDYNSDYLRAGVIPPSYADRNPHYRGATAWNWPVDRNQLVFPAHGTAVNRGYIKGFRRPDGTLREFTAACAPVIYRGGIFPPEYDGNAFVCEPSANVIRRSILSENPDGSISGHNAYKQAEFIASTYERFRPVNLCNGPDGAIYVVDMAHGLIQHEAYETDYVKNQYRQRQLDKYLNTGRIYRIVPDGAKPFPRPHLSDKTTAQLVKQLGHPNGWWRDTAQRLLVERGDYKAIPLLRKIARQSPNPLARLHALWTLEGFRITDPSVILPALEDHDPHIRAAAIRLAEPLLTTPARAKALSAIMSLAEDTQPDVRLQFALTAGAIGTRQSDAALFSILRDEPGQTALRDAVIGGLRGRELKFLQELLAGGEWSDRTSPRADIITALGRCVIEERSPKKMSALIDILAEQQTPAQRWRQDALLASFPVPAKNRRIPRAVLLESPPASLLALQPTTRASTQLTGKSGANNNAGRFDRVYALVHWVGEPGYIPPPPPPPLTPEQKARFERGKVVYSMTCAQCHKPTGLGQEGLAPPLRDSEWVLGPHQRIVRIVLSGLQGAVNVDGRTYILEMPSLGALKDDDIASVLTYVRRAWDHDASPVDPKSVTQIRKTAARKTPWTERELLNVRGD